ncbi:MAG: InlB B-repeat-containing protein, partial [Christensenellales bacterium]
CVMSSKEKESKDRGGKKISILLILLLLLFLLCLGFGGYYYFTREVEEPEHIPVVVEVSFDTNGGVLSEQDLDEFTIDEGGAIKKVLTDAGMYGVLPELEKENYMFLGWYTTNDENGIKIEYTTSLISNNNHTLYARFKAIEFNFSVVYIDKDTDREIARQVTGKVNKGSTVDADVKSILGYTFIESESELSKVINENNTVLTLKYEKNTYTINYGVMIDESLHLCTESTVFKYGDNIQLKSFSELCVLDESFNKIGYTFNGWKVGSKALIDSETITVDDLESLGFTLNFNEEKVDEITIIANYTHNEYTLSLYDGNRLFNSQTLHYLDSATVVGNPSKTGYTFAGWYANPTGINGTEIDGNTLVDLSVFTMPLNDYNVYAGYTINVYNLSVDTNGGTIEGELVSTFTVEDIIELPQVSKAGYDFVGWVEEGQSTIVTTIRQVAKDVSIEATYSPKAYKIYLDLGGGTVVGGDTITYNIESEDITLNDASKNGYTFTGWTGEGNILASKGVIIASGSTGDKYYTANYEIISYSITYNVDEDATIEENPSVYNIETNSITLNNPSKVGYTFAGWTRNDSTVKKVTEVIAKGSTGDLTFTAHFTAIEYTIKLNLNGGSVASG